MFESSLTFLYSSHLIEFLSSLRNLPNSLIIDAFQIAKVNYLGSVIIISQNLQISCEYHHDGIVRSLGLVPLQSEKSGSWLIFESPLRIEFQSE
jgi:hypothetical protein